MPQPNDSTTTSTDAQPLTGNRAVEAFVSEFEQRLEAEEQRATAGAGSSKGRTAATPAASDDADDTAPDQDEEEASSDDSPDDESDDEGEEEAEESSEHGEDDDAAADEGTEGEDADEEGEEEVEGDDTDDAETAEEQRFAAEVQQTLKKHGVKLTLDDLPKEARPIVERRLKEVQAGLTRAMQEARGYRAEEAKFRAEEKFRAEHPELAIAEILTANPDLIEKVQEHIDKVGDPKNGDAKRVFDRDLSDARKAALDAITAEQAAADQLITRAQQVEVYTKTACEKLDIPFSDTIEDLLSAAIYRKPEDERPNGLTEKEIDAILTRHAREVKRFATDNRREQRQQNIRTRTKDRRTTSPARKLSGGAAAGPQGSGKPKTDAEFVKYMEGRI